MFVKIVWNHFITWSLIKWSFIKGIHGEGSPFTTLFGLICWNEIWDEKIPDIFLLRHQTEPLDFPFETFCQSRLNSLTFRLKWLRKASDDEILAEIEKIWKENEGRIASLLAWNCFEPDGLKMAKRIVKSIGGEKLAKIFKRLAEDFRHRSAGMPDLLIWNNSKKGKFKVNSMGNLN